MPAILPTVAVGILGEERPPNVGKLTGTEGGSTGQDTTGLPKYYAMFGGATGLTDTTSGSIVMAPTRS